MLDIGMRRAGGADGIDQLRQMFDASVCALDYDLVGLAADEAPQLQRVHFDGVDVYRFEGRTLRGARRGYQHIRKDRVDDFLISVPLGTTILLSQCGREARVEPGTFAFMTTGRPFDAYGEADSGQPLVEIIVRVAGSLLRSRVTHIDLCCSQPIGIRAGSGRIMRSLLELALSEGSSLSQRQSEQFSRMLLDTIAAATLEAPELRSTERSQLNAQERLRRQAVSYIEAQLSNPELCVRQIAAHCRASVRYLHAAFESSPMTVGELIREQRLQGSRAALRDPALLGQTITEIVMKWGFDNSGSFSRLYKARFGRTPREDRRAAATGAVASPESNQ